MERKVALITGASRGIGEAIAIHLSKTYDVIINYTSNDHAANQVLEKCDSKGNHKIMKANVADEGQVQDMFQKILEEYRHIDVLVNNAGITKDNLLLRMKEEDFTDVIDVNLKGTYHCIRHIAKIMMKQRSGAIVNMASVVGLCGNMGQVNYAASKGGVIALTKAAAKELASRSVHVNAVAPGFIDTDMTQKLSDDVKNTMLQGIPLKRFGSTQDVANVVAFLCSEESSYITGQVITIDGGMVM